MPDNKRKAARCERAALQKENQVLDTVSVPETKGIGKNAPLFSAAATQETKRAEALLAALMHRMRVKGPFCEIVDVTPAFAELLLRENDGNRTCHDTVENAIAADIQAGRWRLNGETIVVSDAGILNDGQHRLRACVKAGRSIQTFVSFGVERSSRTTIDSTQTTRTPGDFLSMEGIGNSYVIASTAAYLWQVEALGEIPQHPGAGHYRPGKQIVHEYAMANLEALQQATKVVPSQGTNRVASRSLLMAVYLLIRENNEERAREFIARVIDGVGLADKDPRLLVRERLLEDKRTRQFWPAKGAELLLRAWNAHRRGQPMTKTQYMGQWPKIAR